MAGPRLEVEVGAKITDLTTGLRKSSNELNKFGSSAASSTNRAAQSFRRLGLSIDDIQQSNRELRALIAKSYDINSIARYNRALQENQAELERIRSLSTRATNQLNNVGRTGAASFRGGTSAAMSFGHILQDIPYGINGVANNITQLTTQLGYMSRSAKEAGISMRAALLSSISNPATIAVLAVSAITTAMVFFQGRVGKAKKATDELGDSIKRTREEVNKYVESLSAVEQAEIAAANSADQQSAKLRILWGLIQDTNTSTKDRARAIQELQNMFPSYFGNLSQEQFLAMEGAAAYRELTAAIIARSRATAREEELLDASKQLPGLNKLIESEEKRRDILDERIERAREENRLRQDFGAAAGQPFAGQVTGQADVNRLVKEREELENRIVDLTAKRIQLEGTEEVLAREIRDIYKEFGADTILDDLDSDEAQKALKKAADDAEKEAERIRKAVEKAYQDGIKASLSARDAEIEATRVKYEELFKLANLSRDQIIKLNEAQANEILQINEKFDEQERKELEKRNKELEKAEQKRQDIIFKSEQGIRRLREQNAFDVLSEAQKETETIKREYDNRINQAISYYAQLIALAQGNAAELIRIQGGLNADLAATEEARAAEMENLEIERSKRLTDIEKERLRELENLHRAWSRSLTRIIERSVFEGGDLFQELGRAFRRMLSQMLADAIATDLIGALFGGGKGSGILSRLADILGGLDSSGSGFLRTLGGIGKAIGNIIGSIFGGGSGGARIGGAGQFANGGIVKGPTMGLVGEYPGAASNPEVISPLSELRKYINTGQSQEIRVYGDLTSEGIHIANVRGEKKYNRFYRN